MRISRLLFIPTLVILSLIIAPSVFAEKNARPTAQQVATGQLTDGQDAVADSECPASILTVACPRASIMRPAPDGPPPPPPPFGAAFNFARPHGVVTTWVGRPVIIRLCPSVEGVWYEQTFGRLFTRLEVQIHRPMDPAAADDPADWVTIGVDGARGVRFGPSIGHAHVRVRHVFRQPGVYRLRALVRTGAEPLHPDDPAAPPVNPDYAGNVVPIDVVVFPGPPPADNTFGEGETGTQEDFSEPMEPWIDSDVPADAESQAPSVGR